MHQSKGLEFDVVFIAGASESEMPNYFAVREGRVEEEKRLFYVALTRAKERLFVSWHERTNKGRACKRSPFVDALVTGRAEPASLAG